MRLRRQREAGKEIAAQPEDSQARKGREVYPRAEAEQVALPGVLFGHEALPTSSPVPGQWEVVRDHHPLRAKETRRQARGPRQGRAGNGWGQNQSRVGRTWPCRSRLWVQPTRRGERNRGLGWGSTWSVLAGPVPSEARGQAEATQELRPFSGFECLFHML